MGYPVLVDADILVFRCGFAAEKNQWFLSVHDEEPEIFDTKREAMDRLDELLPNIRTRSDDEFRLWSEPYTEPVQNALQNVRTVMGSIKKAMGCDDWDIVCYLSGGVNYRYEIAKTRPYKGNRDESHRPTHEFAIRDFFKSQWVTKVSDGEEADDLMGIDATELGIDNHIIVTLDKDLDMIPGRKYNFMHDVQYYVDEEQAWRNFYTQLLTGDSTDNIPGLPKIGPKKAEKMLQGLTHPDDMMEAVAQQYAAHSPTPDWLDYLTEQGQLIWIRRYPGQLWKPPSYLEQDDWGWVEEGLTLET